MSKSNTIIKRVLAVLLLLAAQQAAIAAEDGEKHGDGHAHSHGHDHAQGKVDHDNHGPQHGGKFFEDDSHHGVELVVSDTTLVFHVTEHHEPLDLDGANFKVVVQTDAGTKVIMPAISGNTITADLKEALPGGSKIVLTGKDPHGDAIQARFVKE